MKDIIRIIFGWYDWCRVFHKKKYWIIVKEGTDKNITHYYCPDCDLHWHRDNVLSNDLDMDLVTCAEERNNK